MLNTSEHNSSCGYAEQIVSYLYDETAGAEKIEFEKHLMQCDSCSEELSAFGFVRASMMEWRETELSALEMPAIENPAWQTVRSASPVQISAESVSWFDNLKRLFTFSPKLAFGSAAFAALVACAGLVLFVQNFSSKENIAENEARNPAPVLASNTNKTIREEKIPAVINEEKNVSDSTPKPERAVVEPLDKSKPLVKDSPVKASKNTPKNPKPLQPKTDEAANGTVADSGEERKTKNNKTKTQEIPKLSEFEDDEEESLRLADLFAEIDTE